MKLPVVIEDDYYIWECQDCGQHFCILHPMIIFEHGELLPINFMHWGNKSSKPGCPHCLKRNTIRIEDINKLK
jgi:hypothetical protein